VIDLHTHTTASDGSYSFEEIVKEAEQVGLKALAITDHDTVESSKLIKKTKSSIELIAGVELTVFDSDLGYDDIHVVGLFINPEDPILSSKLEALGKARENQKRATVDRLVELGYEITFEEVKAKTTGAIGRPHIARVLLEKYPHEFSTLYDVFEKLLGRGKKAYVGRDQGFSFREAADLISNARGLSFLAHPFLCPYESKKLIADFKEAGGNGVETYYDYMRNAPKVTPDKNIEIQQKCHKIAEELDLLESGGSDFHGKNKRQKLGEYVVSDEILENIRKALKRVHPN
jgi:predicted metal-dependent phosphoesterase TrpH